MPIKAAFFEDSTAVHQELQKFYTSSKSILRDLVTCFDSFHKDSSLIFQWILSHIWLEENEIADNFANFEAVPNAALIFLDLNKKGLKRNMVPKKRSLTIGTWLTGLVP